VQKSPVEPAVPAGKYVLGVRLQVKFVEFVDAVNVIPLWNVTRGTTFTDEVRILT
jgi:hypothetical protein